MTRPSKREIERAIESLSAESTDDDGGFSIVFEDPDTGEWYDDPALDGEPLDPDTTDPELIWRDDVVETDWERTEEADGQ